jgi:hypothetical protein
MSQQNFNHRTSGLPAKEAGSIIIFTVLILGTMIAITLSLAGIYAPKIRAVGDAGAGSVGAIYAADSAVEWCLYTNRGNPVLPAPTMANGSSYTLKDPTTGVVSLCPASTTLDVQAVGTYRGVSRSLQVTNP